MDASSSKPSLQSHSTPEMATLSNAKVIRRDGESLPNKAHTRSSSPPPIRPEKPSTGLVPLVSEIHRPELLPLPSGRVGIWSGSTMPVDERICYHKLLSDGGRPCYPIELLGEVASNPKDYREILRPWQRLGYPKAFTWKVFRAQYSSWFGFRLWQSVPRERNFRVPGMPQSPAQVRRERRAQRYQVGFSEYKETVKNALAQYGIAQEFRLRRDPAQQDQLTTWLEYLAWAKAWCEHEDYKLRRVEYRLNMDRHELKQYGIHDYTREDWHRYEKIILDARRSFEHHRKRRDPPNCCPRTQKGDGQVCVAAMRLKKMEEGFKTMARARYLHGDLSFEMRCYDERKFDTETHYAVLEWILGQVSLIEAGVPDLRAEKIFKQKMSNIRKRRRVEDEEITDDIQLPQAKRRRVSFGCTDVSMEGSSIVERSAIIDEKGSRDACDSLAAKTTVEEEQHVLHPQPHKKERNQESNVSASDMQVSPFCVQSFYTKLPIRTLQRP
ncbi:hypothetical protein F4810DRAFT_207838 [Camillea tinctor]|nr:hypothetical protein F4810DRAFT_207838 [Camillea tinctor]